MFSFHKPKIYRSVSGCCICKAKSSSSRFTDSKKYEPEFEKCFRINEHRSGEICNACVLLVKRWKKLPIDTNRDWHHVVDARSGPGTKPLNKSKCKVGVSSRSPLKKLDMSSKSLGNKLLDRSSGGLSDGIAVCDDSMSEASTISLPQSRMPSPTPSDDSEDSGILDGPEDDLDDSKTLMMGLVHHRNQECGRKRRKESGEREVSSHTSNKRHKAMVHHRYRKAAVSSFVDPSFWRMEEVCCGVIYKGPYNVVLINYELYRPCQGSQHKGHVMTPRTSPSPRTLMPRD